MIEFLLNDRRIDVETAEQLGQALDAADAEPLFDLQVTVPGGPMIAMLRNGHDAWLMYLREAGDRGFRSQSEASREGIANYTLSNGQVDEYPLSWCLDVEQCYKAIASFCVNDGAQPKAVNWVES